MNNLSINLHSIAHNDKMKTCFYLNFFEFIKKQKTLICIGIQTLNSLLCRSHFGSNNSFKSVLRLMCLSHSSQQILSSSIRLDVKHVWWPAIFRSLHICTMGIKSGLSLGHARTVRDLSRNYSSIVLAVCIGSLSSWKVNRVRLPALSSRFHSSLNSYQSPCPCHWEAPP